MNKWSVKLTIGCHLRPAHHHGGFVGHGRRPIGHCDDGLGCSNCGHLCSAGYDESVKKCTKFKDPIFGTKFVPVKLLIKQSKATKENMCDKSFESQVLQFCVNQKQVGQRRALESNSAPFVWYFFNLIYL